MSLKTLEGNAASVSLSFSKDCQRRVLVAAFNVEYLAELDSSACLWVNKRQNHAMPASMFFFERSLNPLKSLGTL